MKISPLNWATASEATPIKVSHKDRGVILYISEDGELTIEIVGPLQIESGHHSNIMHITLPSDK